MNVFKINCSFNFYHRNNEEDTELKTKKQILTSNDKVIPSDLDSAIEQISQLKSYIESTARELNINFNFNGKNIKIDLYQR